MTKKRTFVLLVILTVFTTLACSLTGSTQKGNAPAAPSPSTGSTETQPPHPDLPTFPASTLEAVTPSQATPEAENKSPTVPAVSDRYPLQHLCSPASCGLTTTPGKVWAGSAVGVIDVYDAKTGDPLQSISLFPGSGGAAAQPVLDLFFDGKYVWVLASSKLEEIADTLFVIDPASGEIVHQIDISQWRGDMNQKMGYSPGKLWTADHIIDAQTFEITKVTMPWEGHYAYDGKGWMWITGSFCVMCNTVAWIYNTDDPTQEHSGGNISGNASSNPLVLSGNLIWVVISQSDSTTALYAYSPDGSKMTGDTQPVTKAPSPDDQPRALLDARDSIWMLAGHNTWGNLYQFDNQTGAILNQMELVSADDHKTYTVNMAYDGKDLWVTLAKELLRIPLE
jgi:hypothetical protein